MKNSPIHRGAVNDLPSFAERFIRGRIAGFEKDMDICLTPTHSKTRSGATHAYFPALGTCCGTLEYLAALYRGNIRGIGWQQVATWADHFMPQPDYDSEVIRILFDAFRHSVAHRGIASGVWIDRNQGDGLGRRLTWKILADSRRPACELVPEKGFLRKDPPWPCEYSHRVHIHLKGLQVDIRKAAVLFSKRFLADNALLANFESCMRQLYPT